MKTGRAVAGGVSLLLLVLFVWCLAGGGQNPHWMFTESESAKSAPELDSFSEPSVALAILKQEARRLMVVCNQRRAPERAFRSRPVNDAAAPRTREEPTLISKPPAPFNGPAAPEVPAVTLLVQLHAAVRDLEVDLDRELLAVYCWNSADNEFLDCYLRLVHQPTEGFSGLQVWTLYALECAQDCGRIEEVANALHHVTRFHGNPPSVRSMKRVLDQWEAEHPSGHEVSKR